MMHLEMVIEDFHVVAMDRHVVVIIMEIEIPNDQVRKIDYLYNFHHISLFFLDACFKCKCSEFLAETKKK
jgi:hypothetical protein